MRYKNFKPSSVDGHISLPGRDEWFVVPVLVHRDTPKWSKAQVNWDIALEMLGGESDTVEIHTFNHWGHGYFSILIAHPDKWDVWDEISDKLVQHSILDESLYSERICKAVHEEWEKCRLKDRMDLCKKYNISIYAARRNTQIPHQIPYEAILGS